MKYVLIIDYGQIQRLLQREFIDLDFVSVIDGHALN